ncbi:unnamed protein product [Sphenostylis stenocarpa]|uniref:Uncharacterized protein n=1 Tax=Sphenostylis stenocarpa TaxID=92480 RepID=A0AA87BAT8_9FABA|nr:unnamed protein product [Sphenostylis stenocarpa]
MCAPTREEDVSRTICRLYRLVIDLGLCFLRRMLLSRKSPVHQMSLSACPDATIYGLCGNMQATLSGNFVEQKLYLFREMLAREAMFNEIQSLPLDKKPLNCKLRRILFNSKIYISMGNTRATLVSILALIIFSAFFMPLQARGTLHAHKKVVDIQRLLHKSGIDLAKRAHDEDGGGDLPLAPADRLAPGGPDPQHNGKQPPRKS